MELVLFTGNRGVGKTLGMSLYAMWLKEQTGCSLYSNYSLLGANDFFSFDDFRQIACEKHSLLLLDECHNDIDSRNYRKPSALYFSHITFYLRKLRCLMFLSTPLFSNIDRRVREVTNILVNVSKDNEFFYYDFYDVQLESFLKRIKIKRNLALQLASKIYDTTGIVTPLQYPNKNEDFEALVFDIKQINNCVH